MISWLERTLHLNLLDDSGTRVSGEEMLVRMSWWERSGVICGESPHLTGSQKCGVDGGLSFPD
jgi:hypothetical protein